MNPAHGEHHPLNKPWSGFQCRDVVCAPVANDMMNRLSLHRQSGYGGDHAVSWSRSSCISAKIPAGGTIPFSVT